MVKYAPSENFYMAASKKINEDAEAISAYQKKCDSAMKFAAGTDGVAWNGMYLMGLALAGLDLVPIGSLIEKRTYWYPAPKPHPDAPDEWPDSYIVEIDAFNKGT